MLGTQGGESLNKGFRQGYSPVKHDSEQMPLPIAVSQPSHSKHIMHQTQDAEMSERWIDLSQARMYPDEQVVGEG